MAKEKDEEQDKEIKEAPPKGKGPTIKWIVILVVVVVLGVTGFVGWNYYANRTPHGKEAVKEQVQVQPIGSVWSMGAMVVNLMDNNGDRYLKTVVNVELTSPDCIGELELLKPKIVDTILDLLSSKRYQDIMGFAGKQRLRDEIAIRMNNYLSKGQVQMVYFTEFIVQ
ncbi:MAG: flagellar basal body-associated FliL family protein [Syntrophales bacterium]|nr:flagellar basal body-associated FliL family protein [Syntrophales bacterium]